MKNYKVEILETLTRIVEVKANSKEEAESIIKKKYDNQEIVLDAGDHIGTDINEITNL